MEDIQKQTVVIADNDADFLEWASRHLEADSVEILTTGSSEEALQLFTEHRADLLIAEFLLRPFDGVELLKRIRMANPNAMVILNGLVHSTNAVIEAMRLGAFDVLRRESVNFELRPVAERALQAAEQMRRMEERTKSDPGVPPQPTDDLIIGRSPAMQDVYKLIGRVARADAPVLITGESGVGKEVVSNAIHKFSRRAKAEYVAINCAAIPSNLLESELFGHEKGAFTGAVNQRVGRFEQCDGGTLFLDEIGDMPLEVQSKLLRVLQSGEFSRVGGNQTLHSDVRILAATNKRLEEEVENNLFREDLFYRLNVVRIHIPPLRRRVEDIRLLAEHFLQKRTEKGKNRAMRFSQEAVEMLEGYHWPGNVRELENLVQRACVLASGNVLLPGDLPFDQGGGGESERTLLERSAERFLRAARVSGESPLALATRVLVEAARRETGSDEKAAALLQLSVAEMRDRLGEKGKGKPQRGGS
ncbi:MAG: sigma-54-dependent Fis family transcriptional regulator [Verrucomicrobiaceae bacterium]|nr:sigma-54-dependent Fis family transcriptional regulator [Verrucomicrobiaceae bacterium]